MSAMRDVSGAGVDFAAADLGMPAGSSAHGASGRGGASGRMGLFLRSAVPDFSLVLVVSLGVAYALLSGFDATTGLRDRAWLLAAVQATTLVALFAGSWSKRAMVPSAVATIAFGISAVGAATALMPAGVDVVADGAVNDVEGNYVVFALVAVLVLVVVFLLSRRMWGVVALFALTVLICCSVQFLYRDWLVSEGGMAAFLAALLGSASLAIYQRFRHVAYRADVLAKPAFGSAAAFSVGVAALGCALAAGVFFGIVQPLGLSTPVIKPFELHIVRPVIEYTGVYDAVQVENPDIRTNVVGEDETDTNQPAEGGQSLTEEQQPQSAVNPLVSFVESLPIFDKDSWDAQLDPVSYDRLRTTLLLAALAVVLALGAAIAARRGLRGWRLRKIADQTPAQRVVFLYGFLRGRFAKLGIEAAPSQTPLEFAVARHQDMEPWNRVPGKVSFVRVTLLYQRAAYGNEDVSENDYAQVERYYRAFFENTRRFVGARRWVVLFWRI